MRIVAIGDVQAHAYSRYPETNKDGFNLRLLDTVKELDRIRGMCVKNKVDVVCVLGDIFEARNALEIPVLNAVYKAMYAFVDHGMRVILLVGNHDRTDVGKEHALEVFKPFCEVIDSPTTLKLPDGDVVAIPFLPNAKAVSRAIKKCVTKNTKLLLMHTAVMSLKMPNGKIWGEGISLEDIPRHVLCLMGHYHRWSELRPGKVWYLGSMIQVDQGDASFAKYFAFYDSKKGKISFHPTKGPKFISIDVEDTPSDSYTNEQNIELEERYISIVNGNFVTVRSIPDTCTDLGAIQKLLISYGARHVEFGLKTQLPMSPPQILHETYNTPMEMEVVKTYVEESDTPLDKEQLIEEGIEIVQEAASEVGQVIEV